MPDVEATRSNGTQSPHRLFLAAWFSAHADRTCQHHCRGQRIPATERAASRYRTECHPVRCRVSRMASRTIAPRNLCPVVREKRARAVLGNVRGHIGMDVYRMFAGRPRRHACTMWGSIRTLDARGSHRRTTAKRQLGGTTSIAKGTDASICVAAQLSTLPVGSGQAHSESKPIPQRMSEL